MNGLDIAIVLLILIPGLLGFRRGLLGTIFTLGGVIAGLILARMFNEPVAEVIANFSDNETMQNVGAFVLIIIAAIVVASIAARLVKGVLSMLLLGWVDNVAGGALGVFMGAAIGTGVVKVMDALGNDMVDESTLAPILRSTFGSVIDLLLGPGRDLVGL